MDKYLKGYIALVVAGITIAAMPFAFFWDRKKKREAMAKRCPANSEAEEIPRDVIERLKSNALESASEYQGKTSPETLGSTLQFYSKAYRIFMEHMGLHGPASPEIWARMRDTVFQAVEAAPDNAVLFNACFDLVDENETLSQELGRKWPSMFRSYQLGQQAKKRGISSVFSSIGFDGVTDVASGRTDKFPPKDILNQGGVIAALDAVRSCPVNPEAWFQLRFHISQAGYKLYAKTFQEVEERLKEAQGAQLLKQAKRGS